MTETKTERKMLAVASKATVFVLAILTSLWLAYELRVVIVCVLVAITLAAAIAPVAEWAESKKVPRIATVLTIFVLVALVYSAAVFSLAGPLRTQATELWNSLPSIATELVNRFPMLSDFIGADGHSLKLEAEDLKALAQKLATQTVSITTGILGALVNVVLVLLLTCYFVVEANETWPKLLLWIPPEHRTRIGSLIRPLESRMGGYVRGQILVCVAVAIFLGTGLTLIKLDYALILGVLAGLFNLVPFVGSFITFGLAVLVAVTAPVDPMVKTALVIGLFFLEQWLESNFIVPFFVGKQVDLHPLIVLFAILTGASIMGLPGALVAVPVASALLYLAQEFYLKPLNAVPPVDEAAGSDIISA